MHGTGGRRAFGDELHPSGRVVRLAIVTTSADHAELSTLRSSLEELTERIVQVGDQYRGSDGSGVAGDLESAERALIMARRAIDRAIKTLGPRV